MAAKKSDKKPGKQIEQELLDQPSHASVRQLFDNIHRDFPVGETAGRLRKARKAKDMLLEAFKASPEYKQAGQEKDAAQAAHNDAIAGYKNKVNKVKRRFQSRGLTEEVKAEVQTLIDDFNARMDAHPNTDEWERNEDDCD